MVLMTRGSCCRKGKGANRETMSRAIKPIKGVNIADVFSSIKRSIDRNTQALTNIEKLLARKYGNKC